jgi:hypothetical protein
MGSLLDLFRRFPSDVMSLKLNRDVPRRLSYCIVCTATPSTHVREMDRFRYPTLFKQTSCSASGIR